MIAGYALYFGAYANARYLAFESGAFDLGVYAQPLWSFTQGEGFAVSLIEDNGPLRWATHVEPILFLIAPLYALWPDPRLLINLQVAAMSLAAVPLYGLAARRLQNEWLALAIVAAYYLMPATESVTLFDFHAVALAPLFVLSALYFLDHALAAQNVSLWMLPPHIAPTRLAPRTAYSLAAIFIVLALSTKEDISLHVFMLGLYLLVLRRRGWEGSLLTVTGLVWFYVSFQVIIPAFRIEGGQSIYAAWFETLGNTPLEIALSPLTAPDKVLALLWRPDSLPALQMILVPLCLLPLLGLPFLAMAAPSLALVLLSQNPTLRQLETWHYAAPMLPFLMAATVDGLGRGSAILQSVRAVPAILAVLLLTVSLGYHHWRGYSALSQLHRWPHITEHHQLGLDLAATIPPDASVLAQAQLIPYVAHRPNLAIWRGPLSLDYDYIWLDLSHPKLPNRFNAHGDLLAGMIITPEFGFAAAQDGYLLLKQGAPRDPLPESLFTFSLAEQIPATAQPIDATFGDSLKLVAVLPEVRRLTTSETEPQLVLYVEVRQPPAEDYHLFLYWLDSAGQVRGATDYPQPALFWWPTSRWNAGELRQIRVNTIPWWTGDQATVQYAVALTHRDDPWDVSARLSIRSDATLLDGGTLLPVASFRRWGGLPYP